MEWLTVQENTLLMELTSSFILDFYWVQDPGLPADVDAAFEVYLENFPEQQFVDTLRFSLNFLLLL